MFWSLFLFRGHTTQKPESSRVTYFILLAYTGTGVSHSQHRKNSGEVWGEKKADEWSERVDTSEEEVPGSKCSFYGYTLTCSRL